MSHDVLLLSRGARHRSLRARAALRRTLRETPGVAVTETRRLAFIPALTHEQYVAVVLYLHEESAPAGFVSALRSYVGEGSGLVVLHSASASFGGSDPYFELLGGRFKSHGPIEPFDVCTRGERRTALPSELPGWSELPERFTVTDELYRHEYLSGVVRVCAWVCDSRDREPVAWIHRFGAGRVFYCSIGHRPESLDNPHLAAMIRSGLQWVCEASPGS